MKNTMINRQVYTQKEVQIIDENGEIRVSKLKLPKCTETVDYNWEKVFMDNFLGVVLALCGKKQTQITFYLIKQKNNDNKVNTTQNEIARACNASIQTVSKTITILKKQNFLKYRNGIYFINPNMLFYGNHSKRKQLLAEFSNF